MNKVARVLIADAPIPSPGYGSWSQRIEYLLQQYKQNRFDYLIAEYSDAIFSSEHTTRFNCKQQKSRLLKKLFPRLRYQQYTKAIDTILSNHSHAIICVIDSLRVKQMVWNYIKGKNLQARTRLIYYQCGFSKYLSPADYHLFTEGVDACIYLTRNAYRYDLLHNPSMPFPVHILHNPINHKVYHPVSGHDKQEIRGELGMDDDCTHFIWASHDRPKKGLEVVLAAWMRFYSPNKKVQLNIVGASRSANIPGVTFHGKIHSAEIHQWFKAADIGVFSSLWPEGFSLSLAEQISVGLLCIASTAGCVSDYFLPEKHGIAIADPNLVEEWVDAFNSSLVMLPTFLKNKELQKNNDLPFLTYDDWCDRFQNIFEETESRFL